MLERAHSHANRKGQGVEEEGGEEVKIHRLIQESLSRRVSVNNGLLIQFQ